jgi:crossover junction endodeoxyribonuclease RuvC
VQNKERILGIDPGTNVMGYGIIEVENNKLSLVAMDVLNFDRKKSPINRLKDIFDGISSIIEQHHPTQAAIEAPFFGKNVQSMHKLGRAQGVAIAAALHYGISVFEYSPKKVKMAITGKGSASKEQLAGTLHHLVKYDNEQKSLDATDALGIAVCHYLQQKNPSIEKSYSGWNAFLAKNANRIIPD